MSIRPLITFKAGMCEVDPSTRPYKVKPKATPGYLYLYSEDDLVHFCWRPRNVPLDQPELDLVMIPGDGEFVPYDTRKPEQPTSKTNGRIFVLKFNSSSARYLFWLQSKPQGRKGNPAWISPRDSKLGDIVNALLHGDECDIPAEIASVTNNNDDESDEEPDNDETMEDVEGTGSSKEHHQGGGGGAGPDATGGDFRKEGSSAREGGADGARAESTDAAAIVRNLLSSLNSGNQGGQAQGKLYPLLSDLLETSTTISMLEGAPDHYVDHLLDYLPPTILVLGQSDSDDIMNKEPSEEEVEEAVDAMSSAQKRALLKKVFRSPQFHQSLGSLSVALRDGGLPSIAEALEISVENGGLVKGGSVPLGGGDAIEAFIDGIKRKVQKKK